MEKRVAFGSGRALIVSRAVLLAGASTVVAVFFALFTSAPPLLPIVLLTIVLVAYGLLFVLSPLLTEHWVTRSRLILRQGWYFRAVVRFSEIEAVSSASDAERQRVPLGINRPFGQPMLFVTGGRTNLVACRLRKPRRFWQAFGLSAREIASWRRSTSGSGYSRQSNPIVRTPTFGISGIFRLWTLFATRPCTYLTWSSGTPAFSEIASGSSWSSTPSKIRSNSE